MQQPNERDSLADLVEDVRRLLVRFDAVRNQLAAVLGQAESPVESRSPVEHRNGHTPRTISRPKPVPVPQDEDGLI